MSKSSLPYVKVKFALCQSSRSLTSSLFFKDCVSNMELNLYFHMYIIHLDYTFTICITWSWSSQYFQGHSSRSLCYRRFYWWQGSHINAVKKKSDYRLMYANTCKFRSFLFLVFFFCFLFVLLDTDLLTEYLKTDCSKSDQTLQSCRPP